MTNQYDITQLVAIPMKNSTLSLEEYDKMYLFELFGIPINVTIALNPVELASSDSFDNSSKS